MYVYWNTADEDYVGKYANGKLQNPLDNNLFNITIKDSNSIINPVILLQTDSTPNFNYARIEDWARYYFVDDIISVRNGVWEIYLREDVLETYADGILNLTAFVDVNEHTYNDDIVNDKYAVALGQDIDDVVIENDVFGTNDYSYVINGYLLGFEHAE